jgi:Tol biopolymer transport system component
MRRTFFWLSLLVVIAAAMIAVVIAISSASAQTTQSPQIAYVQLQLVSTCCTGGGACDAWCPNWSVQSASIVTPVGQLNGVEPTWSADGAQIAFTNNSDIFVSSAAGGTATNITNTANNSAPSWSPSGARIAFASTRDTSSGELYLMNPDGSSVVRLTSNVAQSVGLPAWSPDGGRIAFNCQVESGNDDICAINADGTGFVRLTSDPSSDGKPTWSPDGASIAFATTRYGSGFEIAVMNADGSGVSPGGAGMTGWDPAWSPDGTQIAFEIQDADFGYSDILLMKADGTGLVLFANTAEEPAWMPARVPWNDTRRRRDTGKPNGRSHVRCRGNLYRRANRPELIAVCANQCA